MLSVRNTVYIVFGLGCQTAEYVHQDTQCNFPVSKSQLEDDMVTYPDVVEGESIDKDSDPDFIMEEVYSDKMSRLEEDSGEDSAPQSSDD